MAKSLMLLTILGMGLCDAYKILVVFPLPGKSHSLLGEGVVKHVLRAGHEVTYITPFLMNNNTPKLHQVDVTDNMKLIPDKLTIDGIMNKQIRIQDHSFLMQMTSETNIKTLENPNVQRMMNDTNQTFDAVIVEWLFSELLAGLSAVYDAPLIWISSVEPHWMILDLIDHIVNPAYNSDSLSVNTPPLNFRQRVEELWTIIKVKYFKWSYANAFENEQYERIFGPAILKRRNKVPSFNDVKYSGSLVLGNSHFSMGHAIRMPQNYKHVGGFHIEENVKPLPEDLQKIMDGAKNGVIYFSMGSILNSKDLPVEIKNNLLEMFGKLKQTVLWKFEEVLPNKPENVHILKWAPQASILAHSNCVLFITHGGLLSTTETMHYGVPIIGVPIFADQFINVAKSVTRGYALRVDVSPTMADDLKNAIEEIIGNPKQMSCVILLSHMTVRSLQYTQTAKQLSVLYHDRHMTPGDELIYWVEYVIRTNGAPHLRSPALSVPWYQKAYVDAAAVLLSFIIIVYILIKKIICCIYSKKQEKSIKKNN